ncbi:sodium-dependent lysophosphatidylcholine symporter 1-B-like [Tubulanus polymorphus]|uniref:sodium-dependent lysophosphatidylcholine symporter 1-B-like n=1 Tax=Tubulanus polymorphus TaxID=672921 RepID=UPI003DA59888
MAITRDREMSDIQQNDAAIKSTDVLITPKAGKEARPLMEGHTPKPPKEKNLTIIQKLCYAVGGVPYQMTGNAIGFFISIFFLNIAQVNPFYSPIIILTGKAWDAITDPLVGFFVSKTNTRFGRMRPWIILSGPFGCVAYFFLWYVPDISDEGKLGYYFILYCSFMALITCLHVPYTSLTMYISNNQADRDSATAYRMIAELCGLLLSVAVQGAFVDKYKVDDGCGSTNASVAVAATISPLALEQGRKAYLYAAGTISAIFLACVLTVFFGTKERSDVVANKREPFLPSVKMVFKHGPYVKLTLAFLFVSLAVQIVQGNLALYVTHSLHMEQHLSLSLLVLIAVAILAMPLWQFCLLKIGKKTTFAIGMIIMIPDLFAQLYMPGNVIGVYVSMVIAGLGISVAFLLPWSMLPDVIDDFSLKTGQRKEAIFYSMYVFFNKLAVGVSLGLSQLALALAGYQTGACNQPSSVALTLRMLLSPFPIVCILISLLFLWRYPINEDRRKYVQAQLEQRRAEAAERASKGRASNGTGTSSSSTTEISEIAENYPTSREQLVCTVTV